MPTCCAPLRPSASPTRRFASSCAGEDNRPPVLLARHARVRSVRTVGEGKHLKLGLDSGPGSHVFDAIGFRLGDWKDALSEGSYVDVAYQAENNEWQGQRRLQLNIQDLRAA